MSGPLSAADRLQKLLVMLPWLMERGSVPLDEVAERFSMTEAQVVAELELVAMCGLPPYVDEMIDVFVDDGVVVVGVPRLFTRPLRLTAPEGFSLLAAGRAAMELPGHDPDGPLARGLDKLARALRSADLETSPATDDTDGDVTAGLAIDLTRPPFADEVTDAVADGAELSISYYSPATDESTERTIEPRLVFVDGGHWYVDAADDRSGQRRTFRIDRIESVVRTGRVVDRDPDGGDRSAPPDFFVDAGVDRATVRLAPSARWVVEQFPVDEVRDLRRPAGWIEATMPVASDRWFARLLVRLGPDAVVIEPPRLLTATSELASAILASY